ncbi:VWA domain-containing protein [Oceanimonas baumannii]|nr:VWA domain-containing protein [Oceanimonas baumannii]
MTTTDAAGNTTNATAERPVSVDTVPEAAGGAVMTDEDAAYTFKVADFNFTDVDGDTLNSIRIDSLPEYGALTLNGEPVTAGQEISVRELMDGELQFAPDQNESGRDEYNQSGEGDQLNDYTSFDFSVSDGESWSSESSEMTIDVSPVADTPILSVSGYVVTPEATINTDNISSTDSGFTITALDSSGRPADISIHSNPPGFGVDAVTGGNGAASELSYDSYTSSSESLIVNFDNPINSIEVAFSWMNSQESAKLSFYKDGQLIDTIEHTGGSDGVDDFLKFELPEGDSFDEVRFTAPGRGDDYLINEIRYTQVEKSDTEVSANPSGTIELNVSAIPSDTDGSESIIKLEVSNIPAGVTLTDGTNTFTATDGNGSVDVLNWDLDKLQLQIPDNFSSTDTSFDLKFTTTAEESLNGQLEGESSSLTATDEALLKINVPASVADNAAPTASDDSVTLPEGDTYTLTTGDFGDFADDDGDSLTVVRIDTLPDSSVGRLTFDGKNVEQGQELTAEQINSGKLQFVPTNDGTDLDSSFEFSVSDGEAWSEQSYTTDINIDAVADKPSVNISVGDPQEVYRELTHDSQTKKFSEMLGEERGDSNIYGSDDYDYGEASTQSFDFGAEFAGQTVTIQLPVLIQGSWNSGWYVHNDSWAVKANGEEHVFDNYGSEYNVYLFESHTETITAKLDENGRVDLEFSASTTEKSEIVIIRGATATVEPVVTDELVGYEYALDLSSALADTDGSETLTLHISGLPEGAALSDGTQNADGSWTIEVEGDSYQNTGLTVTVPAGAADFQIDVTATATEVNVTGDIRTEAASAEASANVEMPGLILQSEGESHELSIKTSDITTNLTFVVDVSSSMSNKDLRLSEDAINSIVEQYGDIGTVNINVIQFWGNNADQTGWQSQDQLNFDLHTDKKGTDPEQGLRLAVESYDGTQPVADQDVVFFFGDGNPSSSYRDDFEDFLPTWKDFANNTVDSVKAYGVNVTQLDVVNKIVSDNESPVFVSKIKDFADIVSNIDVEPDTYHIDGQLLDNVTGGDGDISIDGIQIGGKVFNEDYFANGQTISIDGQGELKVNFETGAYSYSVASDEFTEAASKQFTVIASDEDGDSTSFNVDIVINVESASALSTESASEAGGKIRAMSFFSIEENESIPMPGDNESAEQKLDQQPVSGYAGEERDNTVDIDSVLSGEEDNLGLGDDEVSNDKSENGSNDHDSYAGGSYGDMFENHPAQDPFELSNKPGSVD